MEGQLVLHPVYFLGRHSYVAGEDLQQSLVTLAPRRGPEAVQESRDRPLRQLRTIEQHDNGLEVAFRDLDSVSVGEQVV